MNQVEHVRQAAERCRHDATALYIGGRWTGAQYMAGLSVQCLLSSGLGLTDEGVVTGSSMSIERLLSAFGHRDERYPLASCVLCSSLWTEHVRRYGDNGLQAECEDLMQAADDVWQWAGLHEQPAPPTPETPDPKQCEEREMLMGRVRLTVGRQFEGCLLHVGPGGCRTNVHVVITSRLFGGMRPKQRHDSVWQAMRQTLPLSDLLNISLIMAMTPEELGG